MMTTAAVKTATRVVEMLVLLASNEEVSIEDALEWVGADEESEEQALFDAEFEAAECRLGLVEWSFSELYAEMESHLRCKLDEVGA